MSEYNFNYKSKSISLVASEKDAASITIAREVENLGLKVYYLKKPHLYCREDDLPESDNYIILSRHTSSTATPAFTVHSVGNYSPDIPKFGGNSSTLCFTNADLQSDLLRFLKNEKEFSKYRNFDVVAEVTHHGPLLNRPTIYIEMGSSESVWNNKECGKVLAKAIIKLMAPTTKTEVKKTAIAFGGTHYPVKFTNLMINEEYNIGHICAKYSLPFINEKLIQEMIQKTISQNKVNYAILEKKGMKRKKEIKEILKNLGLDIIQV